MGVYIPKMEMPKNCLECPLEDSYGGYACHIIGKKANWGIDGRLSDCPLIELPPHGRLIDADALKTEIKNFPYGYRGMVANTVTNIPTIIESEE